MVPPPRSGPPRAGSPPAAAQHSSDGPRRRRPKRGEAGGARGRLDRDLRGVRPPPARRPRRAPSGPAAIGGAGGRDQARVGLRPRRRHPVPDDDAQGGRGPARLLPDRDRGAWGDLAPPAADAVARARRGRPPGGGAGGGRAPPPRGGGPRGGGGGGGG